MWFYYFICKCLNSKAACLLQECIAIPALQVDSYRYLVCFLIVFVSAKALIVCAWFCVKAVVGLEWMFLICTG